jgi:diguanylate cyclase (GGDEF)-like protein/PAS domain S-box-containing protein
MSRTLQVLCVDDSADDAELNVLALQRHGFTIAYRRVERREDAERALDETQWDLILCDYKMPQFSAPAMLELLAERGADIPCLIVSGAIGEEAAVETIKLGAYDYIFKNNLKRLGPAAERALRDAEIRRARQAMEQQLRERETRLRLLFEQLPALVITTDADLNVTSVEGAQLSVLGMDPEGLIGRRISSSPLIADESRFPLRRAHLVALQGVPSEYEMIWGGKTLQGHVEPLRDVDGRIVGTIAVAFDITERKIAEQRLAYFAQYDPLTDLPNRALFEDRLAQAIAMAQRYGTKVALLTIDLDRFKEINDLYGTPFGDELLRAVAARLRRLAEQAATVSRLGDDEYAILLVDIVDRGTVEAFASRLRDAFDSAFEIAKTETYITGSIGVSLYPDDGTTPHDLFKASEAAMYAAKQAGRNVWRFFVPGMLPSSSERLTLKRDLRSAAGEGQFVLYFQPLFRSTDLRFTGFEALVRWQHPMLGLLQPDNFVPLAEESGAIDLLGEWVLFEVARRVAEWDAAGFEVPRVCVNISPRQFERTGLRETVSKVLHANALEPERLELELTESSIMRDITTGIAILDELKDLGVRLSVDDFGTGYTSLSYLRRFPIDTLKIDKAFVRDMLPGSHDSAIVKAIVTLAKNLGLTSIAEGVESQSALDQLREIGVDELQGFFLSRPIAADDCLAFRGRLDAAHGTLQASPAGHEG